MNVSGRSRACTGMTTTISTSGSPAWRAVFTILLRSAPTSLHRIVRRRTGFGPVQELVVRGHRSGLDRSVLVVVAPVDEHWIVAHPNGTDAAWMRNLLAAGKATIHWPDGGWTPVRATLLVGGPMRDRAIDHHAAAQLTPARQLFRAARGHLRTNGAYVRLDPLA